MLEALVLLRRHRIGMNLASVMMQWIRQAYPPGLQPHMLLSLEPSPHALLLLLLLWSVCRTDKDVILSAAYNWFVSQFQPGSHPPAPDNRSAFVSLSNYIAKCYTVMAVNDIRTGKTPKAAQYRAKVLKTKPLTMAINAEYRVGIEAALEAAAAGDPPGKYLAGYQKNHTQQLAAVWDGPGVKMVALQDDFDSLYDVSLLQSTLLVNLSMKNWFATKLVVVTDALLPCPCIDFWTHHYKER